MPNKISVAICHVNRQVLVPSLWSRANYARLSAKPISQQTVEKAGKVSLSFLSPFIATHRSNESGKVILPFLSNPKVTPDEPPCPIGSEPDVNAPGNELLRLNHRGKTRRRNSVLDRLCQTTAAQDGPHRLPPVIGGPHRNGE